MWTAVAMRPLIIPVITNEEYLIFYTRCKGIVLYRNTSSQVHFVKV